MPQLCVGDRKLHLSLVMGLSDRQINSYSISSF